MAGENNQFLNKPGVSIFKGYVDDTAKTLAKIEILSASDKLTDAVTAATNPTVFIQPVFGENLDSPKYYMAYGAKNGTYYPLGPSEDYIFRTGWKVIPTDRLPADIDDVDQNALYWTKRNLTIGEGTKATEIQRYGLVMFGRETVDGILWEEIGLTQSSFDILCGAYLDLKVKPTIENAVANFAEITVISADTDLNQEATKVTHPTLFMKPVYEGDSATPSYYNGYAVKDGKVYPVGPDMSDILANNWKVISVDTLPSYPEEVDPQAVYIVPGNLDILLDSQISVMNSFILHSSENNQYTWMQLNINKTQMDKIVKAYMTKWVLPAISEAIGEVNHFDIKVVDTLPTLGEPMTLYLLKTKPDENSFSGNLAVEFIWIPSEDGGYYEQIGSADVDLSGYWSKNELIPITEEEMNNILGISEIIS